MKILIATNHLFSPTGSELTVLTLAKTLSNFNHDVFVYSKFQNRQFINLINDSNIKIIADLNLIKKINFDFAYTQHHTSAYDIRINFNNIHIFHACLGVIPNLEQPPKFEINITKYLAISEEVQSNLINHQISPRKIHIFRNIIDSNFFKPLNLINKTPKRALILSYKISEEKVKVIEEACKKFNISTIRPAKKPGELSQASVLQHINNADIVFSLGRGIIESMMCGRIPIIFDYNGGDGIVTPNNIMEYAKYNFSGRKYGYNFSIKDITEQISQYEEKYGLELREISIEKFDAHKNTKNLLNTIQNHNLYTKQNNLKEIFKYKDLLDQIKIYSKQETEINNKKINDNYCDVIYNLKKQITKISERILLLENFQQKQNEIIEKLLYENKILRNSTNLKNNYSN